MCQFYTGYLSFKPFPIQNFHEVYEDHVLMDTQEMASRIGSVDEFIPSSEPFAAYLERVEEYFIANDIGALDAGATAAQVAAADRKKVSVLITLVGKKCYGTLRDLCTPNLPKDKSFTAICNLLKNYYKPKKIEVAETIRFNYLNLQTNKPIYLIMLYMEFVYYNEIKTQLVWRKEFQESFIDLKQ